MQKNNFYSDFNQQSVRDWEKIAQHELGNKNPWENLTKAKQGVTIKPYYDTSDTVAEKKINIATVSNWQCVPKVIVNDEKKANEVALAHLNAGADGILFDLRHLTKPQVLLNNIELPYCSVYFRSVDHSAFNEMMNFIESQSIGEKINGAFFQDSAPSDMHFKYWPNFHAYGIIVKENVNIVDEIVDSLLTSVEIIEKQIHEKIPTEKAFRSLAFSISIGKDFFLSIAKIRALKNVWLTLQEAYQINKPIPAHIHSHSQPWINESFQPHGNMLKQTIAAMAAAIAGCNALTTEPEDTENEMMSRIARNVSFILSEEAQLKNVNDPLAGSYYLDALTHQIASEAWLKFQQR